MRETPDEDVQFAGPCPYPFCFIIEPHAHGVCPDCGAVRFDNIFSCSTCQTMRDAYAAIGGNP